METKKLIDCCEFISDGDHLPPPKSDSGVPFITISNITGQNKLSFEDTMFVPESYYNGLNENKKAKKDDILYSVVGSFGKPVYVDFDKQMVFQRHIAILRPKRNVNARFIYYTMLNPQFYKLVDKLAIGCSQRTVTLDTLRNIEVNLPDKDIQDKMVGILSLIDEKIDINNNVNDNLAYQLKDIYNYWFNQFDFPHNDKHQYKADGGLMIWNDKIKRKIPAGWEIKSFGELCSLRNGINYDKSVEGDKMYRIINVRNISSSDLILNENDLDEISLPQKQGNKYCVSENSIIVARSGIPGATRILQKPSSNIIFCGFIICCTPCDDIYKYYLMFYLKQLEGSAATKTGGSILQNVSQDTLSNLPVPIPPQSLLREFNQIVSQSLELIHSNMQENTQLLKLRDWLLPMLMNGQATISD